MSTRTTLFVVLSWLGTAALAAPPALLVLRVDAPASLQHEGSSSALSPQQAIVAGDAVTTDADGKVGLQLAGQGQLVLSNFGELQIYEAGPALGKFALLAGALRVDSRATQGRPAQDVRLNIGALRTRLLGADAWAARTQEGDVLCLLAGRISLQVEGAEVQPLDTAGSCLRRATDGRIEHFSINSDPLIASAMAATAFVEDSTVAAASPVAEAVLMPQAAPLPAASAAVSADADQQGGWTFVVLSNPKPEPVAARVQALVEQGLPASSRTAVVKGMPVYRASIGRFATHAEANIYAARTLTKLGIRGWAAPL